MITPYFLENFWVGGAFLTPVLFLIILLLCSLPIMYMSDRNIIPVAEIAVWFTGLLPLKRQSPVLLALLVSSPPVNAHFPRRLLFCHPGVWASVEPSNLNNLGESAPAVANWPSWAGLECLWSFPGILLEASPANYCPWLHASYSSVTKFQWEARCLVSWRRAFKHEFSPTPSWTLCSCCKFNSQRESFRFTVFIVEVICGDCG